MHRLIPLLVSAVLSLSACATFQGGMPNLPFNVEEDLGIVRSELSNAASVKTFYANPSEQSRNKFIASRLVITNIEYLKYIKSMSAESAQVHSATDILVLTLDIAATAFSAASTKTVLTALSSTAGGVRLAIDKNAYFEKTMSALIASMNAQRKEILTRIIRGTGMDLNGYPFEQAYADINDYYLAGTLQGALSSIQTEAGNKEAKASSELQVEMRKRDKGFVSQAAQERVDKLLGELDKLDDAAVFSLAKAPPVKSPDVDKVIALRDPQNLRLKDRAAALSVLKMQVSLSQRDEPSLSAWEAAVKSLSK
jgi:hypothetical protein